MLPNFDYIRPKTVEQAIAALQNSPARIHAGGTDLLGLMRGGVFAAETVVSISGIESLRNIDVAANGGLRIGALVTVDEISNHPLIKRSFSALAQAAQSVASPQLRNQGTIGGNLCQKPRCWYYRGEFDCLRKGGEMCFAVEGENRYHCIFGGESCFIVHPSDIAVALLALDARVRIVGPKGIRLLEIADFYIPPGENPLRETRLEDDEVLTEILVPAAQGPSSYRKVRSRQAWDFALAGVALVLAFDGAIVREARFALSGVAPIPWRAVKAEQALAGNELTRENITKAADAAIIGAEALEHNAYKIDLVHGLVIDELTRTSHK